MLRRPDAETPSPEPGTAVLVVDDHRVFTDLMTYTLLALPDVDSVVSAASVGEADRLLAAATWDVVIIDVHLQDGSGLDLVPQAAAVPGTRVLMLTGHPRRAEAEQVFRLGASGYLAKDGSLAALTRALAEATPARPHVAEAFPEDQLADGTLTDREREVLLRIVDGRDATRIAEELRLSVLTVRTHIKSVLAKLGVQSQIEAVAVASQAGLSAQTVR